MRFFFAFGACLLLIVGTYSSALGQCENRYQEEIFDEVAVETVTYSEERNLEMDIYQPVGDNFARRPVILFAHGGSFFAGSKNNPSMGTLCTTFAKRGYVTASYNYNLTSNIFALLDSLFMIEVVMQAVSDGKAAVRYFRQDAANDNLYRADADQIFVGGNSAGAVLALHLAYIDNLDETPDYMDSIIEDAGGLEGNSGNFGYSSEVNGVISLAGGVNKLSFIDAEDEPVVACHGDSDGTVPYICEDVFSGNPLTGAFDMVDLCGGGAFYPKAQEEGVTSALLTFEGDDHTPWEFDGAKMDQVIQFVSDFIYPLVECDDELVLSNDEPNVLNNIQVFPNPTTGYLNIEGLNPNAEMRIMLSNRLGQVVMENKFLTGERIYVGHVESGHYIISVQTEEGILRQPLLIQK